MNDSITAYAAVLFSMHPAEEAVTQTQTLFQENELLCEALSNLTIPEREKFSVLERLFPKQLHSFLKLVCHNERIDQILDIFAEYRALLRQNSGVVYAVLEYVTPLTQPQLTAMEQRICAETGKAKVEWELRQNLALLGGFVLQIEGHTYDRSSRSALQNLRKSLVRR